MDDAQRAQRSPIPMKCELCHATVSPDDYQGHMEAQHADIEPDEEESGKMKRELFSITLDHQTETMRTDALREAFTAGYDQGFYDSQEREKPGDVHRAWDESEIRQNTLESASLDGSNAELPVVRSTAWVDELWEEMERRKSDLKSEIADYVRQREGVKRCELMIREINWWQSRIDYLRRRADAESASAQTTI